MQRAFEIIDEVLRDFECELDEESLNLILICCVKLNRLDKAEELINHKKLSMQSDILVSESTYSIMIKAYGKAYNLQKSFEIFNEIKKQTIPSKSTYKRILQACIICKASDKIEELISEMKSNNINLDNSISLTLLNWYRINNNLDKAVDLYNNIKNEVALNTSFYNSILDCCIYAENYTKMVEIYEEMKENFFESEECAVPDLNTYSILMKGYANSGKIEKVIDIYEFLKLKNFKIDEFLYTTVLDCYIKKGNLSKMQRLFNDMRKNKIKTNLVNYKHLIKSYCKQGDFEKAYEVFEECIKYKVQPDINLYYILIKYQIKAGLIERVIVLFRYMHLQYGCNNEYTAEALSKLYKLVIEECLNFGKESEAMEFTMMAIKDDAMSIKFLNVSETVKLYIKSEKVNLRDKLDRLREFKNLVKEKKIVNYVEINVIQDINDFIMTTNNINNYENN